jgi:hypothetical protein
MTTRTRPLCMLCARFRPEAEALACEAFPDGIPRRILENEVDHREPFGGDHGIRFERRKGVGEASVIAEFGEPGEIGSLSIGG